jgi:hypothetical protein
VPHVIVEGCDGSGKTTLVDELVNSGLARHPRAADSLKGPVKNLAEWVNHERLREKADGVYDRHPLISECIYGPITRNLLPPLFIDPNWVQRTRHLTAGSTMVVWCIPPWKVVCRNVMGTPDGHMPGVVDHLRSLYDAYRVMANSWPGVQMTYDYTHYFGNITNTVKKMMETIPQWTV